MAAKGKTNWNDFTKAELIRTIKRLDKRQTELLNEVAKLKARLDPPEPAPSTVPLVRYPWEASDAAVGKDGAGPWETSTTSMPNPFERL